MQDVMTFFVISKMSRMIYMYHTMSKVMIKCVISKMAVTSVQDVMIPCVISKMSHMIDVRCDDPVFN